MIYKIKKSWIFTTFFFRVFNGLLPLVDLWILQNLINAVTVYITTRNDVLYYILKLIALQFLIIVLKSGINNYMNLIGTKLQQVLNFSLGKLIMNKQLSVPYYYFEIPSFYNHQFRIQSNYQGRFLQPISNSFEILENITRIVSYVTFLFLTHWSLIIMGVVVAIPTFIIQYIYGSSKFTFFKDQSGKLREASYISGLFGNKQSAKELRLFNLGNYLLNKWGKIILTNNVKFFKILNRQNISNIGTDVFSGLLYAFSAFLIVSVLKIKKLSVGNFVTTIQSLKELQSSISHTSFLFASILENSLYLKDFFEFLDYNNTNDNQIKQIETKHSTQYFSGKISIKKLFYKYPMNGYYTLKNISFDINSNEKIAIVGDNGSGKSTLIKILVGLYQPTKGSIYFADKELHEISEEDLRSNITVIFQDFVKYAYSVRENIAFSDISNINNDEKIIKASAVSGVDRLVEKLPKGYHTNLGKMLPDSIDISGGEWQKIALSRALFKNSRVIVLDEPTASLDPKTELSIYNKFIEVVEGKTAIFISHRMASARMADRIIVMKNGEIVEEGSHELLMQRKGEYYSMYESQATWYQ